MTEPPITPFEDKAVGELTRAIHLGETEKALRLIRPALRLEHVARDVEHTPLIAAIENGNMPVFEALLAAGAGVAAPLAHGETPLHAAAHRADEAMARALLARGAPANAAIIRPNHQFHGRTPLMHAAIRGSLPVVKLLLEAGADPFAKDVSGFTALGFAELGGKRVANHLRKVMNASPHALDIGLLDAARSGITERVRMLIDRDGTTDDRDEHGRAPLHYAVMGGHTEVVRLLLERGAPPDARDKRGFTPLALIQDGPEIVKLLLQHGADPNADLGGWNTTLYLAMFQSPEILAPLIDAGGDLRAKAPDGRGILVHVQSTSPRLRKFLKERLGVAPNAFDALQEHMKELPKLAKAPAFQTVAERLGKLFNRRPAPWKRRKGAVYFHDVSLAKYLAPHFGEPPAIGRASVDQASRLLVRLQDELLAEGFLLVYTSAIPEEGRLPLVLLPTTEKYAALIACGTNGDNKGLNTEAVIAWLQAMEAENPFQLAGCGFDFLAGRFVEPIKDAQALAARMIEFCPDIADQAHASIRLQPRAGQAAAIAQEMTKTGAFFFWWD
ncbi:MAG TPA: ankyrin repeat domain-containing protein [Methylomirabilota bacterium]|nr:ankyrin repeat domain-containing protein [Methylomirabilota bacterium]